MQRIIRQAFGRISVLATILLLSACMNIDLDTGFVASPDLHSRVIDQDEDRFATIDPLALNDEIRAMLDEHVDRRDSHELRVEKLQDILYGEDFLNIQYSDAKTHTAIEAFNARQGNCLSVMNLYVAMARYVGVDANFQTVRVQPRWDRRGDLLVLSQHINATGRFNAQKRYVVDFTPEIALQQLTSNIISDQQARALYFNNLGVEALVAGEIDKAIAYYKNALFLDPELSIAWNNIGASYRRTGELELAEYGYQMAFQSDDRNASSINNLAKFYRAQGKLAQARRYEEAIQRFNNLNPYYHYALGRVALDEENLELARLAFRRALRLKEVEPDFYVAMASVYARLGYSEQAQDYLNSAEMLVQANAEIYRPSDQRLRIIDASTILRDSSPGLNIILSD